jgi:hypothetical protein
MGSNPADCRCLRSVAPPTHASQRMTADWSRKFDGRQLITLKDAGTYITKLPKAEHIATEWQGATDGLGVWG